MVRETQKEELKEIMKKMMLSPWTLGISVVLTVYGLYAIIFGIHYFVNSPAYTEGMLIAAFGLIGLLGRHEAFIKDIKEDIKDNIREDIKYIREDIKYIKEKI